MELKLTGKIKEIKEVEQGTSASGKEWKKVLFVISNNDGYEGREQIFAFEIFGTEKVDKFIQYNKVGMLVDVDFNIKTNEWQGKYFTSLQAWKVFKSEQVQEQAPQAPSVEEEDNLPF